MGTDIHMYIERRHGKRWRLVKPPAPPPASERATVRTRDDGTPYNYVSPFWGPHKCMYVRDSERGRFRLHWYENRNYDAFAILTGTVRNGRGFAGVKTSSGFNGITREPRGTPDDVGSWVRDATWDHSESWLMLDEILAFDWDQTVTKTGCIPLLVPRSKRAAAFGYIDWKRNRDEPREWYGDAIGGQSQTLLECQVPVLMQTSELLAELASDLDVAADADAEGRAEVAYALRDSVRTRLPDINYSVRVEWQSAYRHCAADFLAFVDQLLVPLGDPKDTRLVFGFDS
jgi:hypothetical protein